MSFDDKAIMIGDYCRGRSCSDCAIEKPCDACSGHFIKHPDLVEDACRILTQLKENEKVSNKEEDVINHPNHYNRDGAMESINEMVLVFGKEAVKNFCLCNVWKYRYRAADKNGTEDMKKSDWYMKKYKELCANE